MKIVTRDVFAGLILALWLSIWSSSLAAESGVRNGNMVLLGWVGQEKVLEDLRHHGWQCPDAKDWPIWWRGFGSNVHMEMFKEGGANSGPFCRLVGSGGFLCGYHGLDLRNTDQILTLWVKGKGTLQAGFLSYGKDPNGTVVQITGENAPGALTVAVNSYAWIRYQHVMKMTPKLYQVHVTIAAEKGTIDFADVDLVPATPARELMVMQAEKLYGSGALIENLEVVTADATFQAQRNDYEAAIKEFRNTDKSLKREVVASVEREIANLAPYIQIGNNQKVLITAFNDMISLTRVMQSLAKEPLKSPSALLMQKLNPVTEVQNYKPGVRLPRDGMVTVTDVRSNKVRYDENEEAQTRATFVNKTGVAQKGKVIALMHLDADKVMEITRSDFSLQSNETKTWNFSYSVGPETYGREIEVRFEQEGKLIDSWQEFFAVATEWFRVQQATVNSPNKLYTVDDYVDYANQQHGFAWEPTDFGVYFIKGLEQYRSGQTAYPMNYAYRRNQYDAFAKEGVKFTIYQNECMDGQMGYEVFRQHPELAMYDPNGQPAVDPVYRRYPNPMLLESPIETGPKRRVLKPYLNRLNDTSWGHVNVNLASLENMEFEIKSVLAYHRDVPFDGIYVDGNWGILTGLDYEGKPTVPSGLDKDYMQLAARNHRLWSEALKKENPNFGTWYNWGEQAVEYLKSVGIKTAVGSGLKNDIGDENIRAAVEWKNVMILSEVPDIFTAKEGFRTIPKAHLDWLVKERDYVIQRYSANEVIGYINTPLDAENPGPSKWAWPTVNFFGAQMIATQHHFITWFFPSYRPTLQFMTRYSALIWARDIKAVPDPEKAITVISPEEIGWKNLVYRRDSPDGYDLIVHLVRFPPTEHWDLSFVNEPMPLNGTKVKIVVPQGNVTKVQVMRPYYFEEPQQPIVQKVVPVMEKGTLMVSIPPFRYYQMLYIHVATKGADYHVYHHFHRGMKSDLESDLTLSRKNGPGAE